MDKNAIHPPQDGVRVSETQGTLPRQSWNYQERLQAVTVEAGSIREDGNRSCPPYTRTMARAAGLACDPASHMRRMTGTRLI